MKPNRKTTLAGLMLMPFLIASLLTGCGDSGAHIVGEGAREAPEVEWLAPSRPIAGLVQRTVGEDGARAAVVLWSKGGPPPGQAIVLLHTWFPLPPFIYADWLRHLAARGNSIVYPVYQGGGARPAALLGNALAGIDVGLRAVHADPASVVAVGHTTGGALAFDYAASASDEGLAEPRGVFAVYPGRNPTPSVALPPADLSRIPPRTLLEVIARPGNPVPNGVAEARGLLRGATGVPVSQRRYLSAPRDASPTGSNPSSRRVIWAPLDHLIADVRGDDQ